jgi:imidazolonepropionase-like amidohydrolase
VVWRASDVGQLPYWMGADLVDVVVKRGRVVYRRGA